MSLSKKDYLQTSGELFEKIQKNRVFDDSKTFVDSIPRFPKNEIEKKFDDVHPDTVDELKNFVRDNFILPSDEIKEINLPSGRSMEDHIKMIWNYLKRTPKEKSPGSTLIPLPKPYIIPGGRFREIYYWDSYFTMQGLVLSNEIETAVNMIDNFVYLIDKIGHVPNGNRVYYVSRSQPPFLALMIDLISKYKGEKWQLNYLRHLEKEYSFWMKGKDELKNETGSFMHVVRLNEGEFFNRYFDPETVPREESYYEDFSLAQKLNDDEKEKFYNNLRAACESGWDFSSRWFDDEKSLLTCSAANIIPVDLNCLLYFLEKKLSELFGLNGESDKSNRFEELSEKRKRLINKYFWNGNYYFDYNFRSQKNRSVYSLAGIFPLFLKIAPEENAENCARVIEDKFLKDGGVVTTLNHTGQQWDAPNGWAPLQWTTIIGLRNYGFYKLADEIKIRWLKLNNEVFERTGKMFEKYNVEDISLHAGGGEYDLQDGFGWTNGVALALIYDR